MYVSAINKALYLKNTPVAQKCHSKSGNMPKSGLISFVVYLHGKFQQEPTFHASSELYV